MVTLLCVLQSDRHHIPWLGCPFGSGLVYVEIKLGVTSSISFSVNIALTPRPHGPPFRLKTRETFYFASPAMSPRERPLTFASPTPAPPPPRATALWASSLLAPDADAAAVPASKERSWKRTASFLLLLLVLVLCWALCRQNTLRMNRPWKQETDWALFLFFYSWFTSWHISWATTKNCQTL